MEFNLIKSNRYPKQPYPSVVLGYFLSEHRLEFVRPSDNLLANPGPVGIKPDGVDVVMKYRQVANS